MPAVVALLQNEIAKWTRLLREAGIIAGQKSFQRKGREGTPNEEKRKNGESISPRRTQLMKARV